ncbi:C40 family peptidase [Nonomuraea sp. NPDC050663]|uniref:C40 family peptidase n=1 Tax=Nonomuraea sp. NPDC050663 TaxID=3364370 RepID=UPI00379A3ACD
MAVLTLDLIILYGPPSQSTAPAVHQRDSSLTGAVTAPTQAVPQVAPLGKLHAPNLFVVTPKPFTNELLRKVAKQGGVRALELADAATVTIDGKQVPTLGVDPSTFRAYTPKVTARADALWNRLAAGDLAVSFVLGTDGGLSLNRQVSAAGGSLRVGAYATTGFGTIDAIVSKQTGRTLGLPRGNALIVSAPSADSSALRRSLLKVLPKGTQVATVNPVVPAPTAFSGSFMSRDQLLVALKAAISKLGRPYVWGAEGPNTFDCSGLVQWAYAQAGVRMPRVTHQQWVAGVQVPLKDAQPGDLIFWRHDPTNPGYISHVAIYWGNGQMLHAPRTGDVVKLAPVTTRNLAGVVRVNPAAASRVR